MFGGMGKNFWGLRLCFFIDWKVASKKCLKSGSEPSILRYSWSADISRFETILMKNLLKTCAIVWSSVIIFSETISSWPSWETTFFFDERYFRICFYFISKKWLYRLPIYFAVCDVTRINITKEVLLFTPNQAYTEITLLIICFSISVTFCV